MAGQPGPFGVHPEDALHNDGLGVVDHAADIPVTVPMVLIAEHSPTGDGAGLGPTSKRIVRALPRTPALEAGGQRMHDSHNLAALHRRA